MRSQKKRRTKLFGRYERNKKKKRETKNDLTNNDYVDILLMKDEFVLWTMKRFQKKIFLSAKVFLIRNVCIQET